MGITRDITGQKFNRLLAIKDTGKRTKHGGTIWLFKCDCGNYKEIPLSNVTRNSTKSCGCLKDELSENEWNNQRLGEIRAKSSEKRNSSDKPFINNTSGYKNISFRNDNQHYRVLIRRNNVGYSKDCLTLEEAIECRNKYYDLLGIKYSTDKNNKK